MQSNLNGGKTKVYRDCKKTDASVSGLILTWVLVNYWGNAMIWLKHCKKQHKTQYKQTNTYGLALKW